MPKLSRARPAPSRAPYSRPSTRATRPRSQERRGRVRAERPAVQPGQVGRLRRLPAHLRQVLGEQARQPRRGCGPGAPAARPARRRPARRAARRPARRGARSGTPPPSASPPGAPGRRSSPATSRAALRPARLKALDALTTATAARSAPARYGVKDAPGRVSGPWISSLTTSGAVGAHDVVERVELGRRPDPPGGLCGLHSSTARAPGGERPVDAGQVQLAVDERHLDGEPPALGQHGGEGGVDRRADHHARTGRRQPRQRLADADHDVGHRPAALRVDRPAPPAGREAGERGRQQRRGGVAGVVVLQRPQQRLAHRLGQRHVELGHPRGQHVRRVRPPLDALPPAQRATRVRASKSGVTPPSLPPHAPQPRPPGGEGRGCGARSVRAGRPPAVARPPPTGRPAGADDQGCSSTPSARRVAHDERDAPVGRGSAERAAEPAQHVRRPGRPGRADGHPERRRGHVSVGRAADRPGLGGHALRRCRPARPRRRRPAALVDDGVVEQLGRAVGEPAEVGLDREHDRVAAADGLVESAAVPPSSSAPLAKPGHLPVGASAGG